MGEIASLRQAQLQRLGKTLQNRRHRLFLSLDDVAGAAGITAEMLRQFESGKSCPSRSVAARLAGILEFSLEDQLRPLAAGHTSESVWDKFLRNRRLHRVYNITEAEMQTLSGVALMGGLRDPQDFIFILNTIRRAVAESEQEPRR